MRKLVFIGWLFLFGIAEGMDLSHVEFYLKVNNLSGAKKALQEEYQKATSQDDKEQLQYMLAQVALREKDLPQATAIFRKMLAENPALLRVRYELAYLYFLQKEDDSARYHARLALADKNLPGQYRAQLTAMNAAIRRRRAWQLYVSVGMAPDSNVNTMSGKRLECVNIWGLPFCRELEDTESDIGFQGYGSLSYIYKFTDHWGIKTRASVDTIEYKDDRYSFWGLSGEIGPRYVTDRYEYGVGFSYRQQWNAEHRYSHTKGVFGEWQGDLSRRLAVRSRLMADKVAYNQAEYQGYNSTNYGASLRLIYGINNRSYTALSGFWVYEDSDTDWNSNFRQRYGLGYGTELPWGFNIYAEPNITLANYRGERYFISKQSTLERLKRADTTYGVYVTLSNKYLRMYDIMPTVSYIYNKRFSNVNNYDYARTRWEIGISKSF